MTGIELAAKIREKFDSASLEIIGVSSQGGSAISAEFIKSGANDFLIKPFSPEELLCRVNRAVDRIETYTEMAALNQIKNQLLGTAAHDIRGPIGAIKTAADYIVNRKPNPERERRMLEMIQKSSAHLLDLLSDLLDVSSIQGGDLVLSIAQTDLAEVLRDRIELYQARADEKSIVVNTNIPSSCLIQADGSKVIQLVDNLLTNAIKYTQQTGQVLVELELKDMQVEIRVNDSGPGIAEAE